MFDICSLLKIWWTAPKSPDAGRNQMPASYPCCSIEDVAMKNPNSANPRTKPFDLEFDALLHPAQAFRHPRDVVGDTDLTLNEKRAILASWASDACAVEAAPALRCAPGAERPVPVDEILEALRTLDKEANSRAAGAASHRRLVRRISFAASRRSGRRSRGDIGRGPSR
jgi:hypothetical protein